MEERKPILDIQNLYIDYKVYGGYAKVINGLNLKVYPGEKISLVGESGCGKTTCGRTIIKLYEPTKGKILFEGKDVSKLHGKELLSFKKDVQVIFQDPYASLDPRMSKRSECNMLRRKRHAQSEYDR